MMGWLTIIKTIGSYIACVVASVFMAWHGFSELYRWYTTGELLASYGGKTSPTNWQLITYESHPFNFVGLFAIDVMVAAVGLAACVGLYLRIRKWRSSGIRTVSGAN
jgi:hypothetical protein